VRVAEINIPAATAALQLLGRNIGMFGDAEKPSGKSHEEQLAELDEP